MYGMTRMFVCCTTLAMWLGASVPSFGQVSVFQKILATNLKDPVILNIALSGGNVSIGYSHDGQVSIYASGKDMAGRNLPEEFFRTNLFIEQKENQVWVRDSVGTGPSDSVLGSLYSLTYRIDVPYRTQVYSTVSGTGNQKLMGVTGQARLVSGAGDIEAMYVRFAPLEAITGKGNIACTRVLQVNAETGEGNITLLEDGDSKAIVRKGRGKIEVGGARGSLEGSTDAGLLHVKAVLHGDWQLKSESGSIRIELPPKASFEIEASSPSGEIAVEREDMRKPDAEMHQIHEQVNGGGQRIALRSVKGSLFIE